MAHHLAFSVVIPVFNEAPSLTELTNRLVAVFASIGATDNFEIVFVDDGSTDDSAKIIAGLAEQLPSVRGVFLRTNSGKSMALMAGFSNAHGRVVIQMDGDLQDRPEDILALVAKLDEGWDLVCGWRQSRQDTWFRRLGSRLYNAFVGRATGLHLHDHNCGMKAYGPEVTANLCIYGQYHRFITIQAFLLGYKVTECPVGNDMRRYGTSKFPAFRYQGLFDLLSILFTHKYGHSPLHFFGLVSMLFIIPSLLALGWWTVEHILWIIGLGEEYLFRPRPLFTITLTALMLGCLIFLTGFVCDFILHHQIRSRMPSLLSLRIKTVVGDRRITGAASAPQTSQSDSETART